MLAARKGNKTLVAGLIGGLEAHPDRREVLVVDGVDEIRQSTALHTVVHSRLSNRLDVAKCQLGNTRRTPS